MDDLAAPAGVPGSSAEQDRAGPAAWLVCGPLIAAAIAINQSAVHWRDNVVDSHLFAYYGWCVAQGARPYLDVWDNKPPGIWWINAAAFALCGQGMSGELLICLAATLLALVAFVMAARVAYHPSLTVLAALTACILLTHLVYECGANRTETFVVALESVALLCYLVFLRRGSRGCLLLGGVAAGAAALFKQSGVAAGAAIVLHLAWRQFGPRRSIAGRPGGRAWLGFALGLALPVLVAAAVLARQGALQEAWFAVGPFNRAYFAIGDASYYRLRRALRIYWQEARVLQPLVWPAAFAAAGGIWSLASRLAARARPQWGRTHVAVLWLWLLLAAYLSCVGPGRRGHHLMPVLPALGLLALYPLNRLAGVEGLWWRLRCQPSAAVVLVLFGYALGRLLVSDVEQLGLCWSQKASWYGLSYAQPPGYQLQAEAIRRSTTPDERIYVWGFSPGTYRYAYRRCSSRFATFEKVGQLGEPARFIFEQAVADIRADPPAVLVFSADDLRRLMADTGWDFAGWLTAGYEDRGLIGGMHILVRK